MAIVLRNGLELWLEEEAVRNLKKVLTHSSQSKFVEICNEVINTADITGIFTPQTMDEFKRRKNGAWKCNYNEWHEKYQTCNCGELKRYKTYKS